MSHHLPPLRTVAKRLIPSALVFLALLLAASQVFVATAKGSETGWRLQILDAAVVQGTVVRLGEIARPLGGMDELTWHKMATLELWPAPERRLRPMSISKVKLQAALEKHLGDNVHRCILPSSIVIQRGGGLVFEEALKNEIVNTLTATAASLGGEAEFRDFRLPEFLFLRDPANTVKVECVGAELTAGRVSLRLRELAMDGSLQRTATCSVFMDLWRKVPVAMRPLNRGDAISKSSVGWARKNAAYLRSDIWDGKGGPWRIRTTTGKDEVIYTADLEPLPLVTRGDLVTMVYQGQNVRLEVPAEALGEGGYNQSIPVRNMQSQVQVYARVVDGKTVQVF